jgi:hypothetical protein
VYCTVLRSRTYEKKTIKAELEIKAKNVMKVSRKKLNLLRLKAELEIKAKNVMKVSRKKLNLLRLNVLLGHAFYANAH